MIELSKKIMQDEEIVERFQRGERAVFDDLINRYHAVVAKTCFRFLGNKEDAEDATQEIFVKVYKALDQFRPNAKFSTWLYRIAVNHCLNMQRSQKRRAIFKAINPFTEHEVEWQSAFHNLQAQTDISHEKAERAKIVKDAIASLPVNQRTAIILSRYEGLSYKEIAEVIGISISAVESRLNRAKTNLYYKLKPFFKDEKF